MKNTTHCIRSLQINNNTQKMEGNMYSMQNTREMGASTFTMQGDPVYKSSFSNDMFPPSPNLLVFIRIKFTLLWPNLAFHSNVRCIQLLAPIPYINHTLLSLNNLGYIFWLLTCELYLQFQICLLLLLITYLS